MLVVKSEFLTFEIIDTRYRPRSCSLSLNLSKILNEDQDLM